MTETGEAPEFSLFYSQWRHRLRRGLALAIGDLAVAEEAIDEAMTRAVVRWEQIGRYQRPEGWVYRVGLNVARDVFRKRKYEILTALDVDVVTDELNPIDIDLVEALGKLSIKLRSVVVARYYLDWSIEDIAHSLDVPTGTVKSRISRALDRLGSELGEDT